jgi:tRNA/tmRNA/rRNA uracil-C5-methylase (TrmA/RlmC/RlmD family)
MRLPDRTLKGHSLEVEIERILPGGVGLAHAEGRTILVSLSAPGDVVRVSVERTRGKVVFASITEIVKPSPVRVEPPCPYFGRCGGCDFQQVNYETQLKAKVDIIRDCLHRIARIEAPPDIDIHPSPQQWRYRARANWQFDSQARALGYFERGSHRVCDVAECAVLVPELEETLEKLREEITSGPQETLVTDFEAVAGDDGVSVNPAFGVFETSVVARKIGDETYRFNADAFFQTNHDLLEALIRDAIQDARGATAVDLYCGVGLFTLPLARRFEQVIGVESSRTSAEFARRNLANAELSNARVINARVVDWLQDNSNPLGDSNSPADSSSPVDLHSLAALPSPSGVDFLLLDPPRTGAEPAVIEGILALQPKQISYVSCDPATLARDLKALLAGGYFLDSVAAFDMFPQTHHVESVVRLRA